MKQHGIGRIDGRVWLLLLASCCAAVSPGWVAASDAPAPVTLVGDGVRQVGSLADGQLVAFSNDGTLPPSPASADPERVIIQLRGTPLARAGVHARTAAPSLAAQRQRAAAAIVQAVGSTMGRAIGAASVIDREYTMAFHGFAARVPLAARARVLALPDVAAIFPDVRLRADLADSVPLIGAPPVWTSAGTRGAGTRIAVIDTGVDYTHSDLGGCFGGSCKVADGYDFTNNDADPADDNGHGTHVAATAAGSGLFDGVAPDATILAYKVCNASGNCNSSDVIAAIERAIDPDGDTDPIDHADVINLSLGGPGDANDPTSQAVDSASAVGAFVAAAAGNTIVNFGIGSPGAAVSALTVAATTKTDGYGVFSSKGPSLPDYGLKPEIAAPGVSICAAKAIGTALGPTCTDATHVSISGTSMATPHVAGAAALLRAIDPSLTPAEIKSLLVQSSDALTGGALRIGAGRLDLPAAVAARTVVEPAAISFGLDDLSQTIWSPSTPLTITNLASSTRSFSLSSGGFLPSGATLTSVPSSFSLAAGQSQVVSLTLAVDNTVVPNVPANPFAYDGIVLSITAGSEVSRVPVAFFKTPQLQLLFDQTPSFVIVHDRGTFSTAVAGTGTVIDVLVPNGTFDVIALFASGAVVHEGIVVAGFTQHSLSSSEVAYTLSHDPRSELNAPLTVSSQGFTIAHRPSRHGYTVLGGFNFSHAFSSVSSAYDVGFSSLSRVGTTRYWVSTGTLGVNASHVYGNTPDDLTNYTVHYHRRPTEAPSQLVTGFLYLPPSQFGLVSTHPQPWTPTDLQVYATASAFQPNPFYLQEQIFDATNQLLHSSGLFQGGLAAGVGEVFGFGDQSSPTYRTSTGELPLNLGPPYFARRFNNQIGQVFWQLPWRSNCLTFNGQGGDGPESAPIPWVLKTGNTVVQNGNATQTFVGCPNLPPYFPPLQVPTTDYRFDLGSLGYFVAGQSGTTHVSAWFDNGAADPNPPAITGLELRANGLLTDVTDPPTPLTITLRLLDSGLDDVAIAYDDGAGYTALPVVNVAPGVYEATVPTCQPGGVSLTVTATDLSDNRLHQEFTPAYVCRPATCGNSITEPGEACDDGNLVSGDGCNASCTSLEVCGNGVADFGTEQCDDGGTANGDGCSSTCQLESGWICSGTPSLCAPECGDGDILTPEVCDDANLASGDGCDPICTVEPGWLCSGQPSVCTPICGDGSVNGVESCDDGDTANGDGCSSTCGTETGWSCTGQPSSCTPVCGDGLVIGSEQCDDGNTVSGDCCPSNCQLSAACANPGKTVLLMRDPVDPAKAKLVWKWLNGTATAADVGTPNAATGYHLCVWDDGHFIYGASVPPGANWSPAGSSGSFKYVNTPTSSAGVKVLALKTGSGKAKVLWKAKGANLTLPGQQTPFTYLRHTSDVTVRLTRTDSPACWESVYTTHKKNGYYLFKALAP